MEQQNETGGKINHKRIAELLLTSSDWLRKILTANPQATCSCGSCLLCGYRYVLSIDDTDDDTEDESEEPSMQTLYANAEKISAESRKIIEHNILIQFGKELKDILFLNGYGGLVLINKIFSLFDKFGVCKEDFLNIEDEPHKHNEDTIEIE